MGRLISLGKPAAMAILLGSVLAGAEAQEPGAKEPASRDDYFAITGRLKSKLRLECRGVGHVTSATRRTALWLDAVMIIQPDGGWTYMATLGIGASQKDAMIAVKVRDRKVGRLDRAGLSSVAELLAENDFKTLRNLSTAKRPRMDDKKATGYRVTISFGRDRRSCVLYDIVRVNQAAATAGAETKGSTKEMADRYQNICLRLLEIAGAKLDENTTPAASGSRKSATNGQPARASLAWCDLKTSQFATLVDAR